MPAWKDFAKQEYFDRLQKILNQAGRWGLDGGTRLTGIHNLPTASIALYFLWLTATPHTFYPVIPGAASSPLFPPRERARLLPCHI